MLEIGRGAAVIIAGYAAMTVLVMLSTILLGAFFPGPSIDQPTDVYVAGTLAAAFLSAAIGGWVTARLAAMRPLLHVSVMVALLIGVGVFMMTSETRQPGQPAWYPAAIIAIGAAGVFLGGLFRARKVEKITP